MKQQPMSANSLSDYIKVRNGAIEAELSVFIYENDGFKIAYAPALDLMGYGKTEQAAKSSFEVVVEDFFETALEKGTLPVYLASHGWSSEQAPSEFLSPQVGSLLEHNEQLREIFATDFMKQSLPFRHAFSC